jgi:hypothetical protein
MNCGLQNDAQFPSNIGTFEKLLASSTENYENRKRNFEAQTRILLVPVKNTSISQKEVLSFPGFLDC